MHDTSGEMMMNNDKYELTYHLLLMFTEGRRKIASD